MEYRIKEMEAKWQNWWEQQETYAVPSDTQKPKFYVLDMFPYPSGAGLHVGHPLGYIASDIFARFKRMEGFNVLHPMGFDAFGLPAEQYAIQTGVHPAESTRENMTRYREQLRNLGFNYDWSREVNTSDPEYYRWTQWIFLKLFAHWYDLSDQKAKPIQELVAHFEASGSIGNSACCGEEMSFSASEWQAMSDVQKEEILMNFRLAYRRVSFVNWCEELGTVLANDEVKDGLSERGGFPVERRPMLQWSLRITAYAERLLNDMETLNWSDALKAMQRNWIGRSEGAKVTFPINNTGQELEVFTTRPDTIFGVTFMVVAPEHELMPLLTMPEQKQAVDDYLHYVQSRSERDRLSDVKQMTGVFTGSYAKHPFTGEQIPIWTAEYVLKDYGSGAIMAVPSDDDRDRAFAEMADLPIIEIVDRSEWPDAKREDKVGRMINSDFLNGLEVSAAIKTAIQALVDRGIGERKINYKLRDALFSRQRYWGEPFPIVYNEQGIPVPVSESELPVTLPQLDNFKPTADGHSPLARARDWVELNNGFLRETDTMPGYAGSSWYFLRYMDAQNKDAFASRTALDYWQDVDLYIGGTEHAVGHLMYGRFWHKFLFDLGLLPTNEPFKKLINQGMIQGVIESIYLLKEKVNGQYLFRCAGLVRGEDLGQYIPVPVLIDYVREYGTDSSYLDMDSIRQFVDWRPEYKDARFECAEGSIENGVFTPKSSGGGSKLYTHSEVGKMSKSKYNVINPDDVVDIYGADCFRMYEMFLGPIEQSKPWDTKGIDGVSKFLKRFWSLFAHQDQWIVDTAGEPDRDSLRILHQTIQRIRDDINRFSINTCISHFMICVNELKRLDCHHRTILEPLTLLIAPFAPHMAEEIWHRLGNESSVHHGMFPEVNEAFLVADEVVYPVSINGKRRAEITVPTDTDAKTLEEQALQLPEIVKWMDGLSVRKMIIVPGRMINIVAG